jgi:hypothetical protein
MIRRDPMAMDNLSGRGDSQIRRAPSSSGLYDVLDLILDKGIVIDAFVRVSLVGIELLTIDLRVVVASVDTYLRYAEGVERLHVYNRSGAAKLPDVVGGGMRMGAMKQAGKKLKETITGDDDEEDGQGGDRDEGITGTITHGLKRGLGRLVGSITGGDDDAGEERGEGQDDGDEGGGEAEPSGRREKEREPARGARNNGGRAKSGSRR